MRFFEAVKYYFTAEARIKRLLVDAQDVSISAGYSGIFNALDDIITALDRSHDDDDNTPSRVCIPSNDNDIIGIRQYLMCSAIKSGWSSTKLHYIDMLCRKVEALENFRILMSGDRRNG